MRRAFFAVGVSVVVALLLGSCGSGGGDDDGGSWAPNPLYVRASGSDENDGGAPDEALRTISRAVEIAGDSYTIYVGAGTYGEGVNTDRQGRPARNMRIMADTDGRYTGDAGRVAVDATGASPPAGFKLNKSSGTLIDGFVIRGATDGGVVVKSGSDGVVVRNCVVYLNPGDGIRVQDSSGVTIFNNLIFNNGNKGIGIVGSSSGSHNTRVVNNTIYGNSRRGITIGTTKETSSGAWLRNNIIQSNAGDANIKVFTDPPSDVGYSENFDIVFPGSTIPASLPLGENTLVTDAEFVGPFSGDFRLSRSSPAIDAGTTVGLRGEELNILRSSTTTGAALDSDPPDLGYHEPR